MNFRKLFLYVFGAHLLLILSCLVSHYLDREPQRKKIVVHTVQRTSSPNIVKNVSTPRKKEPLRKAIPKKTVPKPAVKKEIPPPKKETPQKDPPSPKKEIVPKEPFPQKREPAKGETILEPSKKESALSQYGATLVSFFQESLDLPEYGEVKVSLEIDPKGQVFRVSVIESESETNEEFLKKRLPELVCPCFNGNHIGRNSFEFTVIFKNR